MIRAAILSACAILCIGSVAQADVFKYVDEKGNVQYTDRPEKLPAQRLNIQSQRTDVVELDLRSGEEAKAAADADKARQQADKARANNAKDEKASTEGKAEACNKARQEYLARMNATRLYEDLPNGERRYLSDKEYDATRASAKQAMDALCN